jgi:hypothetical protein
LFLRLAVAVVEGFALAREARRGDFRDAGRRWVTGQRLLFERLLEHPFDPGDVDQIHGQRSLTRGVEPRRCVAVGEVQELLALAEFGPRESHQRGATRRTTPRMARARRPCGPRSPGRGARMRCAPEDSRQMGVHDRALGRVHELQIPDGTVGKHANGKLAGEVCGAEFDDEGAVTARYIEAQAS